MVCHAHAPGEWCYAALRCLADVAKVGEAAPDHEGESQKQHNQYCGENRHGTPGRNGYSIEPTEGWTQYPLNGKHLASRSKDSLAAELSTGGGWGSPLGDAQAFELSLFVTVNG